MSASIRRGSVVDVELTTKGFTQAVAPTPAGLTVGHYLGSYDDVLSEAQIGDSQASTRVRRFTKFRLAAAPGTSTIDLQFRLGASPSTEALATWMSSPYHVVAEGALALLTLIALCIFSYIIARPIWSGPHRPTVRQCVAIGAANVLSIIGPIILVSKHAHLGGVSTRTALGFVMAASVILSLLLVVINLLLLGR